MCDKKYTSTETAQEFFEPGDRLDVQMIGRFVEQQQVGRAHERLRKQHAPLHTAGQCGEVQVFGQPQAHEHLRYAAIEIPAMLRFDLRLHRTERAKVAGMLRDQMVVAREQRAEIAEPRCDHVEHAA